MQGVTIVTVHTMVNQRSLYIFHAGKSDAMVIESVLGARYLNFVCKYNNRMCKPKKYALVCINLIPQPELLLICSSVGETTKALLARGNDL